METMDGAVPVKVEQSVTAMRAPVPLDRAPADTAAGCGSCAQDGPLKGGASRMDCRSDARDEFLGNFDIWEAYNRHLQDTNAQQNIKPQPPPPPPGALPPQSSASPLQSARGGNPARDVGTPADMVRVEMLQIKKVKPRKLGTIAGRDISALITAENRSFFDGDAQVRIGVLGARDVAYMPAIDIFRLAGAAKSSAEKEARPDKLVAACICAYRDIVWAKTAPNVSAAHKICMDQNLYCYANRCILVNLVPPPHFEAVVLIPRLYHNLDFEVFLSGVSIDVQKI